MCTSTEKVFFIFKVSVVLFIEFNILLFCDHMLDFVSAAMTCCHERLSRSKFRRQKNSTAMKQKRSNTSKTDYYGTTGVQMMRRTGAHGTRGPSKPQTINRLHVSSQLLSANFLFLL